MVYMEVPEDKNNPDWKDNAVVLDDPQFDEMPPLLENASDDEDDPALTYHTNNLHFNLHLENPEAGHTHNPIDIAFYNTVQNYDAPLNLNDILRSLPWSDPNNN